VTDQAGPATANDHQLAASLARRVASMLVELRSQLLAEGTVGRPLGDAGDAQAHQLIVDTLAAEAPTDGLLSEEGADDRARLGHRRVWIVDPLDGTKEFSEPGRVDWAVHIALCIDGRPEAAAVALPASDELFATADHGQQLISAPTVTGATGRPLRIVVSRSRPPDEALVLAAALDAELVPLGSAGAKAMAVVRGDADIYIHAGGQHEWDSCAPVGVATAAGLHTSRIDGSPLVYNQPSPWLPDLLICRSDLAARVLDAVNR
jgi:3'(2'), 5'-bisphosphate nucleotidase